MKWAVLLVLLCGFGCTEHNVNQQRSGIWISFDDRSIEDWAAFYPVIEKYGAKCTFFVTQPDSISAKEFELLKSLQNKGAEIGFHGNHHVLSEYYIKEHSYNDYLEKEIDQGVSKLKQKGFDCKTFAYPYGAKYWFTDFLLLSKFDVVRGIVPFTVNDKEECIENAFFHFDGEKKLNALSIDESSELSNEDIEFALNMAYKQNAVLMLYGHTTCNRFESKYCFDESRLEYILSLVKKKQMRFYVSDELN